MKSSNLALGRRLYIGNLAYATTEAELKSFFKDFLVEAVTIPINPRTSRPVGYAFVDLSTPSEAERAINELNGQVVLERKVSIQLARKPEQQSESAVVTEGADSEPKRRTSQRGRGRGRGAARGRGGRATRAPRKENGEKEGAEAVATPAVDAPVDAPVAATTTVEGEDKERAPRKQRGPPEDGIASKTKVMVANLPYDLDENKLLELFKEFEPTHAKIALRPIPRYMVKKLQARGEARKGRGFGFVTLATEELQQKACTEMNGKVIDGREIAVKVAIDSPGKEDDEIPSPTGEKGETSLPESAPVAVTA